MEKKYISSGVVPITGLITTIFFGIISAVVFSLIYIVINKVIPNIWFAAITAGFFGFAIGSSINYGLKFGKIRNMKVALSIAVFSGLFAIYTQWVIFDVLILSEKGFTFNLDAQDIKILLQDFIFIFSHPNILVEDIKFFNEFGTFSIESSDTVSGILLWLIWFAEVLIIVISTIFIVKKGVVSESFSEVNNTWMNKRNESIIIPFVDDKDKLIREFNNNNFEALNQRISEYDSDRFAEVVVYESPKDTLRFVTINNVMIIKNKANKDKVVRNAVIEKYPIIKTVFEI